jgi:ATP-dependent RNA helicase SUPV3L1/SUV3
MTSALNPATVTAVLGETNTGKTHYAVERMLGRESGVIGLPLRLLAREVYDKIRAIKGDAQCALITGEEKISPPNARYFVCTVEAMPINRRFAFVAVDEIQLAAHPERGHIFTDRILHMRGTQETLLLGAATARRLISDLLPEARFETRERFSKLSFSGAAKLARLPKRSVIVAFSAGEVYAIAELVRRLRGGAAIVMGALSPRTRNAQAALYQSGDVDFLVATDAVGMGLNLDADHVAFAALRKFDGQRRRMLTPMEAGQIAGRAGRFRNDGTFGTTGDCMAMDPEFVGRIENHEFEPMHSALWRNSDLNLSSPDGLLDSLAEKVPHRRLRRVALPADEAALERFLSQPTIHSGLKSSYDVKQIWDVCQIPDFRNLTIDMHVRLLGDIYNQLRDNDGKLPDDFLAPRIARLDHVNGSVDILSSRLANIRTWTYCANKASWINDPQHWIKVTRTVEDRLSDALHEKLTARFVDRRTSALLKGMGQTGLMDATIKDDGTVHVGDHKIGHLKGLTFIIDDSSSDLETKALKASAEKHLKPEINRRLTSISAGQHAIFTLSNAGEILWGGQPVGQISNGGTIFNPDIKLIGGDLGEPNLRALAENRMRDFIKGEVATKLESLMLLKQMSEGDKPKNREARGFAYHLLENNGHLDRNSHRQLIGTLDQTARRQLREVGVLFGHYDIYMRNLVKPGPATLLGLLVAYGAGGDGRPFIPFAGVTSIPNSGEFASSNFTRAAIARAGYRVCGPRIIRFDILNRLSALIRQAQVEAGMRRFQIMQEMLALLGCTYEDMQGVLNMLGYKSETLDPDNPDPVAPEMKMPVSDKFKPKPRKAASPKQDNELAGQTQSTSGGSEALAEETPSPSKATVASTAQQSAKPKLNIFHHRETAEDGSVTIIDNHEYWFRPLAAKPGRNKPQRGYSQNRQKNKPSRSNRNQSKRPKVTRPEDSPFAALAALKNPPKTDKG